VWCDNHFSHVFSVKASWHPLSLFLSLFSLALLSAPHHLPPSALLPLPTALRAGQTGGEVGQTPPAHHPVLPGGLCGVCGLHPSLWLQAPLEWRAGGSAAGSACCCIQRESPRQLLSRANIAKFMISYMLFPYQTVITPGRVSRCWAGHTMNESPFLAIYRRFGIV